MSDRELALRAVARQRLERLRAKAEKLRKHLESDRGKGDHQALHYLLHQVEVERNDLFRNLEKPEFVPKPGKARRDRRRPTANSTPERPKRAPGPKPTKGETVHPIPRPVAGKELPRFSSTYDKAEDKDESDQKGRSWTSAPFVEVILPVINREKVLAAILRFRQADEREVVRNWAAATFGSVDQAKQDLLAGALIGTDANVWRGWLGLSNNAADYKGWTDEQVISASRNDAKNEALWARRVGLSLASKSWVDQIAKAIKSSAPEGADKDTLDRRLRAGLRGFFTAANSGKHTNPQFPYLTEGKPTVPLDSVLSEVMAYLDDDDKDRYVQVTVDDKKRHRVTFLQRELGKAKPKKRMELSQPKWAGRPFFQGTISKRRDASLIWDMRLDMDGLALAVPTGGFASIDKTRFCYQDGTELASDSQLLTSTGNGKGCAVMALRPKHDFRRWYAKHVENHNAVAPMERRCLHNTTQFVVVDPDGPDPRLFIRPVFKFYDPGKTIPDTHSLWQKPLCRYLIGIDRGINYVLRAVVVDTEKREVVADIPLPGRKHEWKAIRDEIAYHQQMRDLARNQGKDRAVVERHIRSIALARKKDRSLGKAETVEAVAKLVDRCENDYGDRNFCFILENLDMGKMNLRRNNRVKHLAAMEDALVYQMRKHGYAFNKNSGKVDGVRFETAFFTSQIAPSGWWAKRDLIEEEWKKDKTRPIGRRVGNWYEAPEDVDVGKADLFRLGRWVKPKNAAGNPYGRNRFVVESGDENPDSHRRRCWGSELFWDPTCTSLRGHGFPSGVVLDADFVGALNIALRPLVNDGQGKGFNTEKMAEAHAKLNPTVSIACPIPSYEFIEHEGNARGALRRIMV